MVADTGMSRVFRAPTLLVVFIVKIGTPATSSLIGSRERNTEIRIVALLLRWIVRSCGAITNATTYFPRWCGDNPEGQSIKEELTIVR